MNKTHTLQATMKGPKMTSANQLKRENQQPDFVQKKQI